GDRDVLRSLPRLRNALANGRIGDVTLIDSPGALEHPQALLASAVADVTILVLRRGKSTWRQLERSIEMLEDAVRAGRVRICLERTAGPARGREALLRRRRPRAREQMRSYS